MTKDVGCRNLAVHNYQSIDWNIVFNLYRKELSVFEEFVAIILSRFD